MKDVNKRLKDQGFELEVAKSALELIAKEGNDPTFGARPLRRAIQRLIEDELSERILEGKFKAGDKIQVAATEDKMEFNKLS